MHYNIPSGYPCFNMRIRNYRSSSPTYNLWMFTVFWRFAKFMFYIPKYAFYILCNASKIRAGNVNYWQFQVFGVCLKWPRH
jgi:hypothetical protein